MCLMVRSYWTSDVLQSTVPGLVLGAIAVICMCGLIIWATIAFCTCWCVLKRRRKGRDGDLNVDDPFRNDDRDAMMAPEVRTIHLDVFIGTYSVLRQRSAAHSIHFWKLMRSGDVLGSVLGS